MKPKVVEHYANLENPDRCFVGFFERYVVLLPDNRPPNAFYFKPLKKAIPTCWYSNAPLGHHTLRKTVSRLCELAGISGNKTNHSLCVTAATQLYRSGIDKQLVLEQMGHRSLKGVHSYKRRSTSQKEEASDILNSCLCMDVVKASEGSTSLSKPVFLTATLLSLQPVPNTTYLKLTYKVQHLKLSLTYMYNNVQLCIVSMYCVIFAYIIEVTTLTAGQH